MRVVGYIVVASVALVAIQYALAILLLLAVFVVLRQLIIDPKTTGAFLLTGCVLTALLACPKLFAATLAAAMGLGIVTRPK